MVCGLYVCGGCQQRGGDEQASPTVIFYRTVTERQEVVARIEYDGEKIRIEGSTVYLDALLERVDRSCDCEIQEAMRDTRRRLDVAYLRAEHVK